MPSYLSNAEGKTTRSYLQGPRGLAEQRAGEATSFPLTDAHGDVTALVGSGGEIESRQSYGPWGEVLSGPSLEMGYLGAFERPTDSAAGLIQMGARAYDPSLGAFLAEDPVMGHLGIGTSDNLYPYVRDDPLNRYDLNGRDVCVFGACAEEAAEDVGNAAEEAGSAVGHAVGSGAEWTWNQTAPARHWLGDRSRDFWKEVSSRAQCLATAISHPDENQECLHFPFSNDGPYEPTEFETEPPNFPGPPTGPQPVPGAP